MALSAKKPQKTSTLSGEMSGAIPAPPAGFVLDPPKVETPVGPIPPPPPGFVLDSPGSELSPVSPEPEPQTTSSRRAIGSLNRGIARFFGSLTLVDPVNALLGIAGLGSDEPVGGAKSIERGMAALGIATPQPGEPETLSGRVMEEVGASVAGLPLAPLAMGAKGAGAVAEFLRQVGRTSVARPTTTVALELGTAASAGLGAGLAKEEFPDNPLAETFGALAGGFGIPTLVQVSRIPERAVIRFGTAQLRGFTPSGARAKAAERVQSLAAQASETGGLEGAIAKLQAPDVLPRAGLTAAEITGNRRLLALEKSVMQKNATIEGEFLARHNLSNEILRDEVRRLAKRGDVSATREFITQRRDRLMALLGDRAQRASTAVEQRLLKLGAKATPEQASLVVREEVEEAYKDALLQAEQLWQLVPMGSRVRTAATKPAIQRVIDSLGKFHELGDLPPFVRRLIVQEVDSEGKATGRLLPRVQAIEEAGDLHKIRQQMLEYELATQPSPARRLATEQNRQIHEAILRDLQANRRARGAVYDTALDFSEELNKRFRQGAVGKVLGVRRTGEASVPDALTLHRIMGAGGPEAGVAADDLLDAVRGADQEVRNQIEDFLKSMFAQQTYRNGKVQPEAAMRFIERNHDLLEQFPQLQADLEDVSAAQRLAERYSRQAEVVTKSLSNKRMSRAALFLEAPVDKEIQALVNAQNPTEAARGLQRMVRRDPTGEAEQGLKSAFVGFLTTRSGAGRFTGVTGEGIELLGGSQMRRLMETPAVARVAKVLFTPSEISRVEKIARTLERLQIAEGRISPLAEGILDPADTPVLEYMVRTAGALVGAGFGRISTGATLRTASLWSNYFGNKFNIIMEKIVVAGAEKLLIEAVQDRELLLSLLTYGGSGFAARKEAVRRLNAWLVVEGGRAVEGADEEVPRRPVRDEQEIPAQLPEPEFKKELTQ